jgi:hypothetical protein
MPFKNWVRSRGAQGANLGGNRDVIDQLEAMIGRRSLRRIVLPVGELLIARRWDVNINLQDFLKEIDRTANIATDSVSGRVFSP